VGLTVAIDARRYHRAAVFDRSGQVVPYFVAWLDHAKHLGPSSRSDAQLTAWLGVHIDRIPRWAI
jgi:hypothetical protein